jgi:predicted naringenin-chalcone synthase
MSVHVLGIGTAVPGHFLEQELIAGLAKARCCQTVRQERLLDALYRNTEIRTRGSVLAGAGVERGSELPFYPLPAGPEDGGPTTAARMQRYAQESIPLALAAAQEALKDARRKPAEVTHLITVSCTGFFAPGPDIALIMKLGLSPETARLHVGFMGCHGLLNGLRAAHAIALQPGNCVLLCAVELCTLHLQYGWEPNSVLANSLFADGAAALVVGESPGDAGAGAWALAASGSCVLPECEDAMTWGIGDHGFQMTLSKTVPGLIHAHLRPWVEAWLARENLSIDAVGSWAVHPGGPRILTETARALGIAPEVISESHAVLAEFGNMSSPTIAFILKQLRAKAAARPCVALGFGPGLSVEAALFR